MAEPAKAAAPPTVPVSAPEAAEEAVTAAELEARKAKKAKAKAAKAAKEAQVAKAAAESANLVASLRAFADVCEQKEPEVHEVDDALLQPWTYILGIPGKNVRGKLMQCFQQWLRIDDEKLMAIQTIIRDLHTASLLIDDIEDDSKLRRGVPVAHKIYGVPFCINAANYVYFLAMEKANHLNNADAMSIFVTEMLNLHRGQGYDILWRDSLKCPTEEQYKSMVLDKTGGLFRLAIKLMQCFSDNTDDFVPLVEKLSLWFQIRDDYINLASGAYQSKKSFCEDLTEGKFSFLVIYAIHNNPGDNRLLNIIKQRTENVDLKLYALSFLRESGAFEYTYKVLQQLKEDALAEIAKLGGHKQLEGLIMKLDEQMEDTMAPKTPSHAGEEDPAAAVAAATASHAAAGAGGGVAVGGYGASTERRVPQVLSMPPRTEMMRSVSAGSGFIARSRIDSL